MMTDVFAHGARRGGLGLALAAVMCLWSAPAAHGQAGTGGTLTVGTAVFTMSDSPTIGTGTGPTSADLRIAGAAGVDSLFATWWWYRLAGDTRETSLFNATMTNWSGNLGIQNFTTPSFTAQARWVLSQPGANAARVVASLTVHNTTAAPLAISLFHYQDFDFAGTSTTDTATLDSPKSIKITETTAAAPFNTLLAYYQGPNSTAYQVTAFSTLRGLLADTALTNLNNTGLPFAAGDFTGGYQFDRVIPPAGEFTVQVYFGIATTMPAICPADFNGIGGVGVQDIFDFLNAWFAGDPRADFNGADGVAVQDIFDFLNAWFVGCP